VTQGPGFFVVLEGPEGSGKSTLASALAARYRAAGIEPVMVREPGGTPVAEVLRGALLEAGHHWTPERELLFMVTARADLVARVIRPALEAGRVVVSDRFDLSTRAYQGAGRGVPAEQLEWANAAATGGLQPDLTLVLDLPPEAGLARQVAGGMAQDRLDQESADFHARVAAFYREWTGPGILHLEAAGSPGGLAEAAWQAAEEARLGVRLARVGQGGAFILSEGAWAAGSWSRWCWC
jgi:dTMP kinase